MNKSMLLGAVVGIAGVAGAVGAIAGFNALREPGAAEVLSVRPVEKTVRVPRQDCRDELVTHQAEAKDPNRIVGSVAGAVIGGIVGNQVGHGSVRGAATAVGVIGGGYAGNQIQEKMQRGDTTTTTERRCTEAFDTQRKVVGYDVRYRLGKKQGTVRMDHEPGTEIPVKDGKLVLTQDKTAQ
jgi:uncharacterized protein YcfJ